MPLLIASCAVALWHGLTTDKHLQPFLAALGLFVLSFVGLGISFYPYNVPGSLTIEEAAAPDSSLLFLLVGATILTDDPARPLWRESKFKQQSARWVAPGTSFSSHLEITW